MKELLPDFVKMLLILNCAELIPTGFKMQYIQLIFLHE